MVKVIKKSLRVLKGALNLDSGVRECFSEEMGEVKWKEHSRMMEQPKQNKTKRSTVKNIVGLSSRDSRAE